MAVRGYPDEAVAPVAQQAESPADTLSEQAKALYKEQKYAEALALFQRAQGLDPRPSFLYNMAKCKEKLADYNGAVQLLENHLTLYRSQNGGTEPPNAADTVRLIADLKRRAFEALPEVQVDSTPRGAQVLENGVTLGNTPLTTHLTPGSHKLQLKLERHVDLDAEVQVPLSGKVTVMLSMKSTVRRSALAFWCNVRGAQIILDGKVVAVTPFAGQLEVEPGPHQVVMNREGYRSHEAMVMVPEDRLAKVNVELKQLAGASSWRGGLGWPLLILGSLAAAGGGVASYFADKEWRGTERFNTLQDWQNRGYRIGGSAAGLGLLLVIWESARDGIPSDDRVEGAQQRAGVELQPLGTRTP